MKNLNITLQELLPSQLSNEAAFCLVNFMRSLALAIESFYFEQYLLEKCESTKTDIHFSGDGDPF
jgi:hypothetical protein